MTGRHRLDPEDKIRLNQKLYYYPISREYDVVWQEFQRLCILLCGISNPGMYKHRKERRLGFVTRRLVLQYVYDNTPNDTIKTMITELINKETADCKASLTKKRPRI